MNRLVFGDLVHLTSQFLECSTLIVFALAQLYSGETPNRISAERDLIRWRTTGKFSKEVETLCLDILSKRVGMNVILKKKGYHIE